MLGQLTKRQLDLESMGEAIDGSAQVRQALGGLGRVMTSTQAAGILVDAGLRAVDATSGALVVLTEDRRELRLVYAVGRMAETIQNGRRFPLSTEIPLADAVRARRELWLDCPDELRAQFEHLAPEPGSYAWAALPLMLDNIILGAIGWSFPPPQLRPTFGLSRGSGTGFSRVERACLRTIARAGGEAMYRAGLYDSERRARANAEIARHQLADQLASAAQRAKEHESILERAHTYLEAADDVVGTLGKVAQLTVPLLGDWCAIDLLDEGNRLQRVGTASIRSSKEVLAADVKIPREPARQRLPRTLRGPRPTVIPNLMEAATRSIGLPTWFVDWLCEHSLIHVVVVPLLVHGRTLGTITLASRDINRRYDEADLALAAALGRGCAAAVDYSRLAASAQEAAQAHEDFVAATSHELRTPLSHIKGFVSTLRTTDMDWDSETRGDFLGEIEREADRLTRLVENLLDMSRIDSASPDTTPRAAQAPAALVAAGADRVGGSIGDHQLELQVPDDLPLVWVEASQVERVVVNLLDNAGKYSPAGQPISVIGWPTGDTVTIRVEDRGLGIPPEHLERIFEPFFREPTDGYPPKPGTGLGLAICRSIVRAQGGTIWAEERAGGGAAFVFTLPVAGSRKE